MAAKAVDAGQFTKGKGKIWKWKRGYMKNETQWYENMETWERDIHDVPGVVADDKVAVSLQILGLQVHLSTGVVVVTFELLVHRCQEMLHRDKKFRGKWVIKVTEK